MSAPRPRPWVTSGWSLRKSTGSPRISSSFNCWARLATCQGQSCRLHAPAQEIKASSFRQERASPPCPDSPSHAHLWHAAPAAKAPALPSHPLRQELCCWTGTFWMRECEAITCQEHFRLIIFPNIWTYGEKNNLLLNGSFGFLQVCIFNRQL